MHKKPMTRGEMLIKRMDQLGKVYDKGEGRPIEELKKTKEILRGQESQRLRTYCTFSNRMEPSRDLDLLGRILLSGQMDPFFMEYTERVARQSNRKDTVCEIGKEYASLRWGPTEVPIYNLLGLFMQILPELREKYLEMAKFYISAEVPVDGTDLSGTPALSHCFSTKPALDLEYAQMLYDAGGDVNTRNRYGAVVAQEIVQIYDASDSAGIAKATKSLEWFLNHGGNIDIADGDGFSPRDTCNRLARAVPQFNRIIKAEDEKRKTKADTSCLLCGREKEKFFTCSKCKKAKYCSPLVRACQKLDWPKHKKVCKP